MPAELAASYITPEVPDVKAALDGARDIIAEGFAENAELIGNLRNYLKDKAVLHSRVIDGKQEAGAKFSDYFDHAERWATVARPPCARHAARAQ
ncbi:Tex-like N-terminal domain-containing protein [Brucella abortus]|nr:Tex-like N-terminal domain-containing protein [Brucella abortus]